jgi:dihydrofolate synthase / folylpolyglutamate synthase
MKTFSITAIQTDLFHPGQDLAAFVARHLERYLGNGASSEKLVITITSKIVSLAENRLVPKSSIGKKELVERESDVYLGEIGYGCHLTVKHNLLIPSAGIDESNSETGDYILFPVDPFQSLRELHEKLCARFHLKELGLIMSDSHTTPLRNGVTGIALAYWGMHGIRSFIGQPDLFGRPLQMTNVNIVDALASAAVLAMGEANECQPLAVIQGAEIDFTSETNPREVGIPIEKDLYGPILKRL